MMHMLVSIHNNQTGVQFPKASSVVTNRVQWNLPPKLANNAFGKHIPDVNILLLLLLFVVVVLLSPSSHYALYNLSLPLDHHLLL